MVVLTFAAAVTFAPACQAQYNIFLRVDGVPGESTVVGHLADIDATAFSFSAANTGVSAPDFTDLSVVKFVDKASPLLTLKCAQAAAIKSVVLFVQSTSPSPLDFYQVTLSNARVTSVSTGGGIDGRPTETVAFTYDRIQIIYTPRKADGTPDTPISSCWDRLANRGC